MPFANRVDRRIWWLTVSKAVDRSSKISIEDLESAFVSLRASTTENKAVSVECPLLKPDWLLNTFATEKLFISFTHEMNSSLTPPPHPPYTHTHTPSSLKLPLFISRTDDTQTKTIQNKRKDQHKTKPTTTITKSL